LGEPILFLYERQFENPQSSFYVERRLAAPGIEVIFRDLGKSGSVGLIGKMAQPKVLLNNVSNLRDRLISFFFIWG